MSFADKFREKYRVALYAARENNREATLAGLEDLYKLFAEQYSLQNGDSIVVKAKLSYWQQIFAGYVGITQKYGLQDRRVQKFFGLVDDTDIPSFADLLNGQSGVAVPDAAAPQKPLNPSSDGGVVIDGIVDLDKEPENDKVPENKPFEPIAPVSKEKSEVPQMPEMPQMPVAPETPETSEVPEVPETPEVPEAPEAALVQQDERENNDGEPRFNPDTLEGFIGQQHIVKALLKEIKIAKAEHRSSLDNVLLLGNPGLGKTTLAQLVAKALGVRFEWMDCSQYRNSQQSLKALQSFLTKVASYGEPVVLFFDEVHMLTPQLQSSLLTLLQSRVYVSPPDNNGVIKRIPIEKFTFIGATTNDNELLSTIKDRCLRLKFQLVDYTPEELKLIYRNKVAARGLTITDEAIDLCIPRSRGSIRYVNAFVDGLKNELYNDDGIRVSTNIDADVVNRYFNERGIDAIGLEKKDLEILRTIAEDSSGAIGVDTLAARVGLDSKKYLSEYEPYLIKIGFISVTGRGRSLEEKALKYLKGEEA